MKENIKRMTEILLREFKLHLHITQILKIGSNLQFFSATLKTFWELGSQVPALFPPLGHAPYTIHVEGASLGDSSIPLQEERCHRVT